MISMKLINCMSGGLSRFVRDVQFLCSFSLYHKQQNTFITILNYSYLVLFIFLFRNKYITVKIMFQDATTFFPVSDRVSTLSVGRRYPFLLQFVFNFLLNFRFSYKSKLLNLKRKQKKL